MSLPFFRSKKSTIITIIVAILLLAVIATVVTLVIVNNRNNNAVKNIYISSWPEKLQYYVGEDADYTGLVIGVLKHNGTSEYVTYSEETKSLFTITGFDSSKPAEDKALTIAYGEYTCNMYITVKEVPKPAPILVAITLSSLPKTEYKVGDYLSTDGGMILKEYSDGTFERTILINSYVSGWEEARDAGPGTYTLTVKYKEGGTVKKTTYDITITE